MSFVTSAIGLATIASAHAELQERKARKAAGLPPRPPSAPAPAPREVSRAPTPDDVTPFLFGLAAGTAMSHHETSSPAPAPDFSSGGGGDFGGGGADGSW